MDAKAWTFIGALGAIFALAIFNGKAALYATGILALIIILAGVKRNGLTLGVA